jgi:AraC family transcriptional regulator of adaptative response/methylated-DNA-[protein]-cysteine methyltransferase
VRAALQAPRPPSVTTALHDAGYGSSSRFYAASPAMLGMKPSDYRDGGRGAEIRFAVAECSLGAVLVAATAKGVCSIQFGAEPEILLAELQQRFSKAKLVGGDGDFEAMVATVIAAVETPGGALDLPLDVRGTAFQLRVWQALRDIPPGHTASYADIAARIGAPRAVRAVAGACAANPVAVAIPCHRVVRTDGGVSGYRWGVDRKRALLEREAVAPA